MEMQEEEDGMWWSKIRNLTQRYITAKLDAKIKNEDVRENQQETTINTRLKNPRKLLRAGERVFKQKTFAELKH